MMTVPYIIQVQICLALFWLAYRAFIRNSGAFGHNRAYLLGSAFFSFIIPLLSIPVWPAKPLPVHAAIGIGEIEAYIISPVEAAPAVWVNWPFIGLLVCITGVLVMLAAVIWQAIRLARSVSRARVTKLENVRLVCDKNIQAPFSFFHFIFVSEKEAQSRELPQIVAHEMAHVRLRHSYDSVFAQILLILFWWNPFVWLWNRSLKEVHEFQADAAVLDQGFDTKQYITLLMGTLGGIHPEFVSGFSYSLIKNRLIMMTKNTARSARWRMLAGIPILAITLLLFSFTEKKPMPSPETVVIENLPAEYTLPDPTPADMPAAPAAEAVTRIAPPPAQEKEPFVTVEEMPKFNGGDQQSFRQWVMQQLKYPVKAAEENIQGRVTMSYIVEEDGTVSNIHVISSPHDILSDEAMRVLSLSPPWTPGKQRGENVRVRFTIPMDFSLRNDTPDPPATPSNFSLRIRGNGSNGNAQAPLYIVDGKEVTESDFWRISQLEDEIHSIDVLNDAATRMYGEKGQHGVVLVVTKANAPTEIKEVMIVGYGPDHSETGITPGDVVLQMRNTTTESSPLFVVDGILFDQLDFGSLDQKNIESIEIIKDSSAIRMYGEKGKNGVVRITMKKTAE